MKGFRVGRYIFFEMLPPFFFGVIVFVFILLFFQAIRLTEFVLIHGVKIRHILSIVCYLSISFLPALLPMSLLFAVTLSYMRLNGESEIVAMKSLGLSLFHLLAPAFVLGFIVACLSAQTTFQIAPWGNHQFDLLITKIGKSRSSVAIREGVFSEGFFNLVVYANRVDSNAGELKEVFIYDERNSKWPITILSKSGLILRDQEAPDNNVTLRLLNGHIHRPGEKHYTKIDFMSYDINLFEPMEAINSQKSPQSWTFSEILDQLKAKDLKIDHKLTLLTEFHKRWALSIACLIFAFLGVGLSITRNQRQVRAGGMILTVGVIVTYWTLYLTCEACVMTYHIPPAIALWCPNLIFGYLAFWQLKKAWN